MESHKFHEFLRITRKLNEIQIIPLLMGSVGLEVVTEKSWDAQDLDIHVPGDKRDWEVPAEKAIFDWDRIVRLMDSLGYCLVDLHEHEFLKSGLSVEFGIIDTLPSFAGVLLEGIETHQKAGAKFYLLTLKQYLRVHEASSKDSYRADKNNYKDIHKIEYLKTKA
ncbi:phosphoribosylanthranilate isomerase [Virgibacillus sp. Bac332]|uniref:phosphoribosylanthranilate isomerase n=1 Tax=Virgibacillus sp. Bac332 TaxID=2419842 RepID=UPI000EF4AB3F|nr:phosphoribosylanthranilate isomerase [Virgibacillus sp. Bac332]